VIITAGFGETGTEGKALEREVLSIAREGRIGIVGPNTQKKWGRPRQPFKIPGQLIKNSPFLRLKSPILTPK